MGKLFLISDAGDRILAHNGDYDLTSKINMIAASLKLVLKNRPLIIYRKDEFSYEISDKMIYMLTSGLIPEIIYYEGVSAEIRIIALKYIHNFNSFELKL